MPQSPHAQGKTKNAAESWRQAKDTMQIGNKVHDLMCGRKETGEKRGEKLRVYQLTLALWITGEGKHNTQPKQATGSYNRNERCQEQKQVPQLTGA